MSKSIADASYVTQSGPVRGSKIPQQPAAGALTNFDAGSIWDMVSGRARDGHFLSDNSTGNRRVEWPLGLAGNIAGKPVTFYGRINCPTTIPAANAYLFAVVISAAADSAATNNSLTAYLNTSGGLIVRVKGADQSVDHRTLTYAGFRAAYSGVKDIPISIVFEVGDSSTNPKIYFYDTDVTSLFTLTTGGSNPNWMATTLDCTKFLNGFNWCNTRFTLFRVCLGAWTAAEVSDWAQSGREPMWCEYGTGSAVALTSGTLKVGWKYFILSYLGSDSFTNVGAASNATGVSFIATGVTPTTWTSSSQLIVLGPVIKPILQPVQYTADYGSNDIYGTITTGIAPVVPSGKGTRASFSASFAASAISATTGTTLFFVLPVGWNIVDFQCNVDVALDSGVTLSVGSLTTAGKWVNALLVDTTGLKSAPIVQTVPQSLTTATNVYLKKSASTTVGNIITVTVILERKY